MKLENTLRMKSKRSSNTMQKKTRKILKDANNQEIIRVNLLPLSNVQAPTDFRDKPEHTVEKNPWSHMSY